MVNTPGFMNSPFFVEEPDNWHLLPGAPEDVQHEFDEFMAEQQRHNEEGVFV